jgi:hypothetical protein
MSKRQRLSVGQQLAVNVAFGFATIGLGFAAVTYLKHLGTSMILDASKAQPTPTPAQQTSPRK